MIEPAYIDSNKCISAPLLFQELCIPNYTKILIVSSTPTAYWALSIIPASLGNYLFYSVCVEDRHAVRIKFGRIFINIVRSLNVFMPLCVLLTVSFSPAPMNNICIPLLSHLHLAGICVVIDDVPFIKQSLLTAYSGIKYSSLLLLNS